MKTLTVSKASKHLSKCLKRVYDEHQSFELVKNGVPYARLVPARAKGCNTHELADDLSAVELSREDRRALRIAVRKGRKRLRALRNPWA